MADLINHPKHYTKGKYETIDVIEDIVSHYEPFEAYIVGNIIKYIARAPHKGVKRESLLKAQWYLKHLIEKTK